MVGVGQPWHGTVGTCPTCFPSQKCVITRSSLANTCLDLGGLQAKFTLALAPRQSQGYWVSPQDLQSSNCFHPVLSEIPSVKHVFSNNTEKKWFNPPTTHIIIWRHLSTTWEKEIDSNDTPKSATQLEWEGSRLKCSRNRNPNPCVFPSPCPRQLTRKGNVRRQARRK